MSSYQGPTGSCACNHPLSLLMEVHSKTVSPVEFYGSGLQTPLLLLSRPGAPFGPGDVHVVIA